MIVIPERQVRVDLCLAKRGNQFGKVTVVSRLPVSD